MNIGFCFPKNILLFILFLLPFHSLTAQSSGYEYGLHINSYPLPSSEYTSMVLNNGSPIETGGEKITLNFDLWVRSDNVFGTIFRIITGDGVNIDLMYSVGKNDERIPMLVTKDEVRLIKKQIRLETWINVNLVIDPVTARIKLRYDGSDIEFTEPTLKKLKSTRVAFGLCPFEGYGLSDVASVNLRNIHLKKGEKEIGFWKMAQHDGDICYDELHRMPASGKNTTWLIDQYITWKKIYEHRFNFSPSIAFDSVSGNFFMAADRKQLYIFNCFNGRTDTVRVKGGEYVANSPNQLIYVAPKNQLISYNLDENTYSLFDFPSGTWRGGKSSAKEHDYWNNTIIYNNRDSALVSFGGYGHYLYNNQLLFSYPFHLNKPQQSLKLSEIIPRYTPASAIVGNTLYVFGGRGSPSGHQELSPRNYYDLYSIDLSTKKVARLWEMKNSPENGDFVPGENMVFDSEKKCFYVFTTQQGGTLLKMDLQQPHFEVMSKPIGIKFDAQYLYTNLYLSSASKQLYAAVVLSDAKGKSTFEVYEINYPPISIKNVEQRENGGAANPAHKLNKFIYALIALLLVIMISVLYYRRYITSKKRNPASNMDRENTATGNRLIPLAETAVAEQTSLKAHYDFSKKCICFLGGFRVVDKNENDISSSFSPTLKSLLIILILYSGKDLKGIHGNKIIQVLWHDKTEESAKNNRNVYISKLRTLLEEVGDIKIINQNGFWKIQIEDNSFCDYLEAIKLFEGKNSEDLEKLLELLLHGEMLPDMHLDWIDVFKSDFSNKAIDLLSKLLKEGNLSDNLQLRIADAIFKYDFLSEEALQVKCHILHKQRKYGLAKTIYDNFCNEYRVSLGMEYKCSFMDVIERKCEGEMNN